MEVRVVVEATTKRVLHHNHAETHAVSLPCPLLHNGRSESRKIMLQMPMVAEYWPEHVGHSQNDPNKGDVWKRTPLLSLPELRAAIPAGRTAFGLASVIKDFLFRSRRVNLATKNRCSTIADALEVLPNCG